MSERHCHVTVHHSDYGEISADCTAHGRGRRATRHDPEYPSVTIEAVWSFDENGEEEDATPLLTQPWTTKLSHGWSVREQIEEAALHKVADDDEE